MAKRPCFSDHSSRVSKRDYDRFNIDALLESFIAVSDSDLIDASFDGLVKSRSTDSDQNNFIQRAIHLGSVLLEAGKRSDRKRSSVHNASVWPLSPDLTVKVFSMLDTPSLCSAAATCSFFQKCAIDPLCYADIDLATLVLKVNDAVVSTVIQRAGNALRSIKLGVLLPDSIRQRQKSSLLTSSCLSSLRTSGGAPGSRLRRMHLHNIERMDDIALSASLSVCPSLVDLEIVKLNVEVSDTLESVSKHCRLVERFIYESEGGEDDLLESSVCIEFVLNCPKITTLALKACALFDSDAHELVKGLHELKYVDFTYSSVLNGSFLENLGTKLLGGKNSEVLILRDCMELEKVYIEPFMEALLTGKFGLLRHVDISNRGGLAYYKDTFATQLRCCDSSSILLKRLLRKRPNLCFVAKFPDPRYV